MLDLAAESRRREAHRYLAVQIVVIALKYGMRLDVDHHIKIAGRTAVDARLAFAREPDAIALVHACGNLHRQRLVLLDAPRAAAVGAGGGNDLAGAVAAGTGLLDREKAL